MMVIILIHWEAPEGMAPGLANEKLQERIEILGGKLIGKWEVDCEVFYSVSGIIGLTDITGAQPSGLGGAATPQQAIYILHNSNYSLSTFAILENNTVLIADSTFDLFLPQMKAFYAKKGQKSDARGSRYDIGDFVVKTGVATYGASQHKTLILEVTYLKSDNPLDCTDKISELAKLLLDASFPGVEIPTTVREDKKFSPTDLMLQYKFLFSHLKKPTGAK